MNEREERGPWYLLTGLILGIVLGLLYAWVIRPVEYIDTTPNTLSEEYKERQRALIARAYLATGSIGRARARLELLEDDDLYGALTEQAQAALRDGSDPDDARALGLLSVAIGQSDTASSPLLPELPSPLPTDSIPTTAPTATAAPAAAAAPTVVNTPLLASPAGTQPAPAAALSPSPTPPPTATLQPTATRAFTATPGAPFALKEREALCDPRLPRPMLQVFTLDAAGGQVAGMEIILTWAGGVERFYTGLKPEIGLGYADFALEPGEIYTLRLADGGATVSGLAALQCPDLPNASSWGAWRLTFAQP